MRGGQRGPLTAHPVGVTLPAKQSWLPPNTVGAWDPAFLSEHVANDRHHCLIEGRLEPLDQLRVAPIHAAKAPDQLREAFFGCLPLGVVVCEAQNAGSDRDATVRLPGNRKNC
jgi:hypothetical protein